MKVPRPLAVALLVATALAVAIAASAANRDITPIPAFSAAELTALPADDWLTSRGDIYNRQFSSLDQINKQNVSTLKVAWHTKVAIPTPPGLGKAKKPSPIFAEGEAVVYKGTMYMPDPSGNVFAFDAVTGERQWYYKPKYPKGFAAALPTSRGVTLGGGKVFHALNDATIVALDPATGRVTWKTKVEDYKRGYHFTSPPTYVNGTLVIGESGGDSGAESKVVGLDGATGKIKWKFNVIPTGSEFGAKSWPKKRAYLGGGAVWAQAPVDPELGLVYVAVGNPVPYNGNARGVGDELFTESVVALRVDTGKYVWHYQTIHHDIWDYDIANPLVLFDLKIKGQDRKGLAAVNKNGWVYILDRKTGKPILGIPEKAVPQSMEQHTSKTQPRPVGQPYAAQCPDKAAWSKWKAPDKNPVKIGCTYTPYNDKQYTAFAPGVLGGANWPPSSFSPKTGNLYICSKDGSAAWKALPEMKAGSLKPLGNFFQVEGLFPTPGRPDKSAVGTVVAMNMRSNTRAWTVKFPAGDICYSGVMSTQGGLVFVGRSSGYLEAYDDQTGKLVWKSPKLVASVNAPPMTYSVDGKQYVAVYAGGAPIGGSFGTVKQRIGSDLYAFALPS